MIMMMYLSNDSLLWISMSFLKVKEYLLVQYAGWMGESSPDIICA